MEPRSTERNTGTGNMNRVIAKSGNRVIDCLIPANPPIPNPPINYPMTRLPDYPIHSRGFTLIELMVVMTLIVILATMGLTQYRNSQIHAKEAVLREDLFRMRDAIDQYYADKNQYPGDLSALVSDGYMREVPKDPFTDSADSWQTIPADPDASNPTALPGIYNVKRGSEGTAQNCTQYAYCGSTYLCITRMCRSRI